MVDQLKQIRIKALSVKGNERGKFVESLVDNDLFSLEGKGKSDVLDYLVQEIGKDGKGIGLACLSVVASTNSGLEYLSADKTGVIKKV